MIFKKKIINFESESLSIKTWRRFKHNKVAMFGLIMIFFSCLISILGYLITSDQTPYCNDQKPELHIKYPGFKTKHLLVSHKEIYNNVNSYKSEKLI